MKNEILKKVVYKLRVALDRNESKEIAESLRQTHDIKKRNDTLERIVSERDFDKNDVQELMYDLTHTHQMLNLKKPKMAKKDEKILFKIKTVDVAITVDGKEEVLEGGKVYEVIAFEKGKFYVTNKEYKPGVPQLIPWSVALRI